ncbi:hypothetical protein FFI89_018870 [Bradyrhizobium sp. KBS0727]|uniref:hypothetical protein n=1 Tax=unclassified Bradyrhizobium TaxID=2631580 RepID=UPI00110ED911|nr:MULTISPECIES: hypothetical protein [unclassified Bradyrhizobium]QDW39029.1 hypothetical protein FFI71_018870 [Bradyrhizobium sp. KBS0725]QDW45632.1 hypothetical protein FFI89_018870 [Bradyrhizobium sp. KBS0727]
MPLYSADYTMLRLLKFAAFERHGDRWRFGTRSIADSVVTRLVNAGRAERVGDRVQLIACQRPEGKT